jgi:hypothetical protein
MAFGAGYFTTRSGTQLIIGTSGDDCYLISDQPIFTWPESRRMLGKQVASQKASHVG